jgi:hypothetical protein
MNKGIRFADEFKRDAVGQSSKVPVHDSLIVHHDLLDDLTSAMQEAFEVEFGATGEVSYQLGDGERISTTGQLV